MPVARRYRRRCARRVGVSQTGFATPGLPGRVRAAVRGWPAWEKPRHVIAYLISVELLAGTWAVLTLTDVNGTPRRWTALAVLCATAIAFEEGSRRAARLKIRLGSVLRADMSSVWAVAAAVALPRSMAAPLLVAIFVYDWFRQFRPAGEALFRKLFVAATVVVGALVSSVLVQLAHRGTDQLPWLMGGLISVVVGIVAYTTVNRLLVTVGLVLFGVRGRELLGSGDDNLVELATLCLGGLVSLAVLYEPWLVVLAIPPMFTLQRGALMRELEAAATTDAKTGLLNAIAWEHLADRELARATRDGSGLAVLIIDIDRFKRVNDVFGHLVGDIVLRRVGRAIAAEMREYDGVGRFGGEEFVAVLPHVSPADAMVVAERVRNRVNRLRMSELLDGAAVTDPDTLSVSIGVSCTESGASEVPELLRAADAALYAAKEGGRNRVVLADDGAAGSSPQAARAQA